MALAPTRKVRAALGGVLPLLLVASLVSCGNATDLLESPPPRAASAGSTILVVAGGSLLALLLLAALAGFVLLLRDVKARRRVERQLRKLSQAVEHSPAVVMITDAEGRIEYVNPKFSQVTGFTSEEALGRNPRLLQSGKTPPQSYRELWSAITSGKEWRGELHNRKRDGGVYWASASISPIVTPDGEITHFVGVQEDITAFKFAQEELRQAKEAADEANRAKSEFLSSMSHEIRTPMNAIVGMAELLWETDLTPEQRRYVEVFRSAGENLLDLIDDILDLSKVEAGQILLEEVPFDLGETVDRVRDVMAARARGKGIEMISRLAPEVPESLVGDPVRLRQVLTNLIGNAIKFTDRGEVVLEVGLERPDRRGEALEEIGGICGLHFSVRDTGIGIAESKQATIFDRFTQADSSTSRKYGGTGLGLAISKRLVELMGGRIWVESRAGHGSTFHFTVEVRVQEQAASRASVAVPEDRVGAGRPAVEDHAPEAPRFERPLRILLVDDAADNRLVVRGYLRNTPHRIDAAENGEVALRRFRSESYDLVLMDMQMPVMDGYSATRAMREWEAKGGLPATPIIALTAYALPEEAQKSRDAGCDAHVAKPIRKASLMETLRRYAGSSADPHARQEGRSKEVPARVDPDLRDLIPGYLNNRRGDLQALREALAGGDYETIRLLGHRMRGSGGIYGFEDITEIGRSLEEAAGEGDGDRVRRWVSELSSYLERVGEAGE